MNLKKVHCIAYGNSSYCHYGLSEFQGWELNRCSVIYLIGSINSFIAMFCFIKRTILSKHDKSIYYHFALLSNLLSLPLF